MSKQQLLCVIQTSLEEDRKNPEAAFKRMVKDGLIDKDGRPVYPERKLVFTKREPEPDERS